MQHSRLEALGSVHLVFDMSFCADHGCLIVDCQCSVAHAAKWSYVVQNCEDCGMVSLTTNLPLLTKSDINGRKHGFRQLK